MTVEDLQIGSPVYRVQLDSIDIAHVFSIEQNCNFRKIGYCSLQGTTWNCVAENKAKEINGCWFVDIEDAKLAQLMRRSEHVEKLKKTMENAQNGFAEAIQKYAFAEPSTPKEM